MIRTPARTGAAGFAAVVSPDEEAKLGGAALALLALVELHEAGGGGVLDGSAWDGQLPRLARFLLFQQGEDGRFASKYFYGEPDPEPFESIYYPGEAILALMRLHQLDREPRWLAAARRGADWLIDVRDAGKSTRDLPHDHWLLMALEELHDETGDERYLEHAERIAGAIVGLSLVSLLAGGRSGALTLILAGVAVNTFAAALTSLALNLAPSPYAALEIVFWLLGSLADRSFEHVRIALPFMVVGWFLLLRLGRALDALSIGEEAAASLGYSLGRLRGLMLLGVGLSVGASVAVSGAIGFIGLVVPHLLRPLVGHRPGALLPASALGGAALTLAADIGARVLSPGPELKLGVLTALIGAPFFLYLLIGMRRANP